MNFPVVYAVKHKNFDIRMASRSGGVFTAFSDCILSENGVVYGCVLNENFEAEHIRADNENDRNRMRGSKYIQSNLGDTFRQVKNDLQNGKKVLFSGTSCQIAGLKGFLQKDYAKQLLCVDVVCYGVPSSLVWKKYLEWQEKKNNAVVINADFRNKKDFGWADHIETLTFASDNKPNKINSKIFRELFSGKLILRPACYKCPYKDIMHPADITIADYWGIDKASPGFNDNKGVSLVLINNKFGEIIFDKISASLEYRVCKIEDSMQPALKAPFSEPENRSKFWKDFRTKDFGYIVKKYGTKGFIFKVKKKLRKIFK